MVYTFDFAGLLAGEAAELAESLADRQKMLIREGYTVVAIADGTTVTLHVFDDDEGEY